MKGTAENCLNQFIEKNDFWGTLYIQMLYEKIAIIICANFFLCPFFILDEDFKLS